MSVRRRVLLVQNTVRTGPGRLPSWFADEALDAVVVQGPDLDELEPAVTDFAGVVLLGGALLPDDDERAPFLAHERELIVEAMTNGVPLLGICLGAQLLAHVGGGAVTPRSGETERGSCAITVLPAAADDPLFGAVSEYDELRVIQNHDDSITALPPDAVLLATSDACRVQAFRLGATSWGVQFHPEADAERIATWDEAALSAAGLDRAALLAAARSDADVSTAQARALVGAFATIVRGDT